MPRKKRFLTKKEFRAECGYLENQYLSQYIRRGEVIVVNEEVDANDPINQEFIRKQHAKKTSTGPVSIEELVEWESQMRQRRKEGKKKATQGNDQALLEAKRDRERREEINDIELRKKKEDLFILEIKRQKATGEVVPVSLVQGLINNHFKQVVVCFHQAAQSIVEDISSEFEIKSSKISKARGNLIEIINKSVEESVELSLGDLDKMIKEYQKVKGQGEKN